MKKKLICLLVLCACAIGISSACFAQGSSVSPYITQHWRSVLGFDTPVHQPIAGDSTTFFQILDANGDLVFNANSTNRQVTIGYTSVTYPFLINSTDGSNQIEFYHTNAVPYIRWTLGDLNLVTNVGTNTDTYVFIKGKGTGRGRLRAYDQDDSDFVEFFQSGETGFLYSSGTTGLSIQETAEGHNYFFQSSTEGETKELIITGFRTGDASRTLRIGMGVDFPDTASFDNASNYWFDGTIKSTNGAQLGDGGLVLYNTTHEDSDGGRESKLDWWGEQSGGERTTLARIEVSHDGAADDQKGKVIVYVNDGDDGDTPTQVLEMDSAGYVIATGMVRQGAIWHAYGGFEDQAEVIACGVGDWNWITNGDPWDLWTCDEEDGISCALDVFTIANTGDYMGNLSVSISGLNGKDFHVRVYNNTQARAEGRPIGISTTGANNEMNISVPVYIEATAGDEIQFEIMSADGSDPVVDDALFWISYLHD